MNIVLTTILLFAVFGILLFIGCPISVGIVISSIVTAVSTLSWDQITFITMQKMNSGVESFSLLAVPLFILAGNIMNNGGIARRLVNFAKLFCGWIPGSLAQANVLGTCCSALCPVLQLQQVLPWAVVFTRFRRKRVMTLHLLQQSTLLLRLPDF